MGRETSEIRTQHIQPPLDVRLAGLAGRQYGIVTLDQLRDLGLSASAVRQRVAVARLHTVHRGVYALVPGSLLAREARYIAAVLACGPGAVLSYRSAAALQELRRTDRAKIDVTIPGRSPRKHPGIDVHRSTTLAPRDVTHVRNIPCTTVARTLLDLAQVVQRRPLERACDQAEIIEVLDVRALRDQIERNWTRPAARRLKAVLEEHYIGSTATWSELEESFLAMCRAARLPQPEVNAWLDPDDDDPSWIRADFVWRKERLVVEADGRRTHRTMQAFEHDRRRDQRLARAGWQVIRATNRQVTEGSHEIAGLIDSLLRR